MGVGFTQCICIGGKTSESEPTYTIKSDAWKLLMACAQCHPCLGEPGGFACWDQYVASGQAYTKATIRLTSRMVPQHDFDAHLTTIEKLEQLLNKDGYLPPRGKMIFTERMTKLKLVNDIYWSKPVREIGNVKHIPVSYFCEMTLGASSAVIFGSPVWITNETDSRTRIDTSSLRANANASLHGQVGANASAQRTQDISAGSCDIEYKIIMPMAKLSLDWAMLRKAYQSIKAQNGWRELEADEIQKTQQYKRLTELQKSVIALFRSDNSRRIQHVIVGVALEECGVLPAKGVLRTRDSASNEDVDFNAGSLACNLDVSQSKLQRLAGRNAHWRISDQKGIDISTILAQKNDMDPNELKHLINAQLQKVKEQPHMWDPLFVVVNHAAFITKEEASILAHMQDIVPAFDEADKNIGNETVKETVRLLFAGPYPDLFRSSQDRFADNAHAGGKKKTRCKKPISGFHQKSYSQYLEDMPEAERRLEFAVHQIANEHGFRDADTNEMKVSSKGVQIWWTRERQKPCRSAREHDGNAADEDTEYGPVFPRLPSGIVSKTRAADSYPANVFHSMALARDAFGTNSDDSNAGGIADNLPVDYPKTDSKTQGQAQKVQYSLPQHRVQKVAVPVDQDQALNPAEDNVFKSSAPRANPDF